jgi:hypothetical protein
MRAKCLAAVVLVCSCRLTSAINAPSLTRANVSVALQACQESDFAQGEEIADAIKTGDPTEILRSLPDALKMWRATPATSSLYGTRAFCIHELVPNRLPPGGSHYSPDRTAPTETVLQFHVLGIEYFYYDSDDAWTLKEDPVDLSQLAAEYLDSRWGRQAFLMMTRLGWSHGACQEGPDQFREVIKHGESFLRMYPESEVSNSVRLEMANAYATWWNASRRAPNPPYSSSEPYMAGAEEAKQRAIELYRDYLKMQKNPAETALQRLSALEKDPKGSNKFDYLCEDYED